MKKQSSADHHVHSAPATKQDILTAVAQLTTVIIMKVSELTGVITSIQQEVDKAKAEILGKIKDLEDALNNATDVVPNEVTDALDALKASVKAVDDIVPDPVPTPTPTPTTGGGTPPAAALAQSRKSTL